MFVYTIMTHIIMKPSLARFFQRWLLPLFTRDATFLPALPTEPSNKNRKDRNMVNATLVEQNAKKMNTASQL
jgi:hypothetical protein